MASQKSVGRKTLVRVKRRRDQPSLEAIVVKDGSSTKRLKLHDALSRVSLENDAKSDQVFHFVSSVPESQIATGSSEIMEKVNSFSAEFKRRSEVAFSSGAKRRTQQQKTAQKNRSLQRLKRIESQRPNINAPKDPLHPDLKIVDCAMVDEEPPVSQISDDLCNSLLDEVEKSKLESTNLDDEKKHEGEENVEYVYDYFCKVQRPICDDEHNDSDPLDLHDYLDRLLSTSRSAVHSPRLGDLYLSLGVDGQSDEELDDNFNQESEVDEDDSNREHSDYPDADILSDGEEEVGSEDSEGDLSDYVDTSISGQMKSQNDQNNFLKNAIAYDPELDDEDSDGYMADAYDF